MIADTPAVSIAYSRALHIAHLFHKLVMRTSLRNPPMFHNVDAVTVPDRSQSVGNYHASRIAIDLRNCIFNAGFGDGIQIAGRFIQNQQLWFFSSALAIASLCRCPPEDSSRFHPAAYRSPKAACR